MKKHVLCLAAALTAVLALAGCGKDADSDQGQNGPSVNNTEESVENGDADSSAGNEEAGLGYQMGLGVVSRMKRAVNADSTDGSAEVDTVIAAVSLDAQGRIVGCTIDMVQQVIPVSNTGAIGTPAQTEFATKKELGDSYGLKAASEIGKEWYEQVQAFEQYAIGKTAEEISQIAVDDHGYVQDQDLNSSVSISITDFQAAIVKAAEHAY